MFSLGLYSAYFAFHYDFAILLLQTAAAIMERFCIPEYKFFSFTFLLLLLSFTSTTITTTAPTTKSNVTYFLLQRLRVIMESESVPVATFAYQSTSSVMGHGIAPEAQTKTL